MLSTKEAFEKFRQRLELSDTEQKDAERRHADVRDCIRGGFDIKTDFLSGSYRRHTKTKPLKDVDVLFVLGAKEQWRRDRSPIETLQAFEIHLKKKYTGKDQVEMGRRAVTIEFEKKRIGKTKGLCAPAPRERAPWSPLAPPRPSGPQQGVARLWLVLDMRLRRGRVAPQRCPGEKASGRAPWEGSRGHDYKTVHAPSE